RLESEKKWEESRRRWEELREELKALRLESEKKWEESRRRWEELREELKALRLESEKKWEEHSRAIRFLFEEVKDLRKRYDIGIGALGARWGIKSEDSFRRALKGLLEENFPVKVERYVTKDLDGEVFEGYPGQLIELDLIIRDGELIVAELKSSISVADVWLFERKVRFFEKKEGKRVTKRVIISPMIDPRAEALIIELGITAYTYVPEPEEGL
ncbi:MAG: DUF3782 domain-containing protein, partial [Thermodesulfobacteriaceae bacterium]|nr:DUF3782 domain-containing protein [Thermodesulfobacteriaceae bacterium]